MARTTTAKKEVPQEEILNEAPEIKTEVAEVEQPLNLEQQVTVKNIAPWTTGFARILTIGDVTLPKGGSIRLSRNEIISQIHNGNKLFCGIDNMGGHATLIINDAKTLEEVGFTNENQFNDSMVRNLFSIEDPSTFEKTLKEKIVTRAEKRALMTSIVKQGLNDFSKIRFCEKYTGFKIDVIKQDESNIR